VIQPLIFCRRVHQCTIDICVTHVRGLSRRNRERRFRGFPSSASRPFESQPFREAPRTALCIREAEQKPPFRVAKGWSQGRLGARNAIRFLRDYASRTRETSRFTHGGKRGEDRVRDDVLRWYAQVSSFEKPFVAFRFGECSPTLLEIANAAAHAISFGYVEENAPLPSERSNTVINFFSSFFVIRERKEEVA